MVKVTHPRPLWREQLLVAGNQPPPVRKLEITISLSKVAYWICNVQLVLLDCLWHFEVIQIWKWLRETIRSPLNQSECLFFAAVKGRVVQPLAKASASVTRCYGTCGLAVSLTVVIMNCVWIQIGLVISTQVRVCETCSNISCFHDFIFFSYRPWMKL